MINVPMVIWLPFVTWLATTAWYKRDKWFGFDDEDEEEKHADSKQQRHSNV